MHPTRNCGLKTQGKWPLKCESHSPLDNIDHKKTNLDEDLALFHDMRRNENKNFLHPSNDDIDASLKSKFGGLTGFTSSPSSTPPWVKGNDLLATDAGKNDYDWLLTPPETPLFPSLDKDAPLEHVEPILTCITQPSRIPRPNTREMQNKTCPPTPPSTRTTSTQRNQNSIFVRQGATTPLNPSREDLSPMLINVRPHTPTRTLSRSSTSMNRASSARLSPTILRRMNTSPSSRSSSIERNNVVSTPRGVTNLRGPKNHPWQSSELGFSSAEPPPNLRTSFSDRPISNSRGPTLNSRSGTPRYSSGSRVNATSVLSSQEYWSTKGSCIIYSSDDGGTDIINAKPHFHDFNMRLGSFCSTEDRTKPISQLSSDNHEVRSIYRPTIKQHKKSNSSVETSSKFLGASVKKSLMEIPSMGSHHHHQQSFSQILSCPILSNDEEEQSLQSHLSPGPIINVNGTIRMSLEYMDKRNGRIDRFNSNNVNVDKSFNELMEKNRNDFTRVHHQTLDNIDNNQTRCKMQKYQNIVSHNHQLEIKDEDFIDIQEDTSMKGTINHGKKSNPSCVGSKFYNDNVEERGFELSGNAMLGSQKKTKSPISMKNHDGKDDATRTPISQSPINICNIVNKPRREITLNFNQPDTNPNSSIGVVEEVVDNIGTKTNTSNIISLEGKTCNNNIKDNNTNWKGSSLSNMSFQETSDKVLLCTSIVHEIVYEAVSKGEEKEKEKYLHLAISPMERKHFFNSDYNVSSLKGKVLKKLIVKPTKEIPSNVSHKDQRDNVVVVAGGNMERNILPLAASTNKGQPRLAFNSTCGCNIM